MDCLVRHGLVSSSELAAVVDVTLGNTGHCVLWDLPQGGVAFLLKVGVLLPQFNQKVEQAGPDGVQDAAHGRLGYEARRGIQNVARNANPRVVTEQLDKVVAPLVAQNFLVRLKLRLKRGDVLIEGDVLNDFSSCGGKAIGGELTVQDTRLERACEIPVQGWPDDSVIWHIIPALVALQLRAHPLLELPAPEPGSQQFRLEQAGRQGMVLLVGDLC